MPRKMEPNDVNNNENKDKLGETDGPLLTPRTDDGADGVEDDGYENVFFDVPQMETGGGGDKDSENNKITEEIAANVDKKDGDNNGIISNNGVDVNKYDVKENKIMEETPQTKKKGRRKKPTVKSNLKRMYIDAIRTMHVEMALNYKDRVFKARAIKLYEKINTLNLEKDEDFEFLDPFYKRDIVQFTDSYSANNCELENIYDGDKIISVRKIPADVSTLSYGGGHLILHDGYGEKRSLMQYRSVAKPTIFAGKLIKGGALQQRWYKYLSKELGGRRVAYATDEELIYIAEQEGIKVPKRGSVYGYVNLTVEKGELITFRSPVDCISSIFGFVPPTLEVSIEHRDPEAVVDFRKGRKSLLYPQWDSDEAKLEVHDKYIENVVISVYRGKRLVGEAFLPIHSFSEIESLQFEGKITIYAPRNAKKSKLQQLYDYIKPRRGKLQVLASYTKSAAEELNGLSYRRALIQAIGLPVCDLPRNLDNKKEIKIRGDNIKKHKAATFRWGKVKDRFNIPNENEHAPHHFKLSPTKKKSTIVPILKLPTK